MQPEPRGAADDVRLNALAVHIVHHVHMLAGQQIGGLEQGFVDGDRTM